MIKRTLYFTKPSYLSVKNKQLVVELKEDSSVKTVPVEDIGFMVIEDMQISISTPLIEELMNYNVAVIFCDSKHHPQSMLLNFEGNHQQTEVYRQQVAASEPLKKNLWKQTVEAKIENQAKALIKLGINADPLPHLANQVKSGDSDNREGMAARIYWKKLFGDEFNRERYGDWPNALLNYGYIVLRAAAARALTGSGLLPSFGIFHKNRFNAFCLADDIMEPYRPFVDLLVYDLYQKYPESVALEKEMKAEILNILSADVGMKNNTRPLMVALTHTSATLVACYKGERKNIEFPEVKI
ncbi:MAG: type II CRISPR-associated endonuclease Cas1 [Bacteroidales bacterium]|jgi:CRISPR-associated protein Cas1|nr:type II CRISPR-associated endonuclease Cas1 [Bacteroidales bacterium]